MTFGPSASSDNPAVPVKSPFKALVRARLRQAVRVKRMKKPSTCSVCNQYVEQSRLHGHHYDYAQPFIVSWMCLGCHNKLHGGASLKADQVIEIERLARSGASSYAKIAKQFGIATCTVHKIKHHKSWKHIWNEPAKNC